MSGALAALAPTASAQGNSQACAGPGRVAQAPSITPPRICRTAAELNALLRAEPPFSGRIVIPKDAQLDLTGLAAPDNPIPIRSGVEIVGERGDLASRPRLFTRDKSADHKVFQITGSNVRIEGLHFQGWKKASTHKTRDKIVFAIYIIENAEAKLGRNIVITDNEFNDWSGGGVELIGAHGSVPFKNWDASWQHLEPKDASLVRVERNYFHHNIQDGRGYGVVVGGGAYVHVEGNVFDYQRHAVAGSGKAYSGYIARFNYVLQGGYMQHANNAPDFHNQHFDMHGDADGGYGGYAGEYFEIAHNTVRGEQGYYCAIKCAKARPILMLRGKTRDKAVFNNNVAVHDDLDEAVSLKPGSGIGEDHRKFNFQAGGNRFDTDYSGELAGGDFDGDGRSDVFVANGTAWFFSRAGLRPWQYLRPSDKRVKDLAFADIDNDRRTDVIYRDGAGRLSFAKSGGAPNLTAISSPPVPVPARDLRFGDFDGDGLTDMFFTQGNAWRVWNGRTRALTEVNTSNKPISELLFGEFDDVRGTDVAGVNRSGWSISSGATTPWLPLNKSTKSFGSAVAGDFNGNGRSDVLYKDGDSWMLSDDGRASPRRVRKDGSYSPRGLVVGRFDGTRDFFVGFGKGDRLSTFPLVPANPQNPRTPQNMR